MSIRAVLSNVANSTIDTDIFKWVVSGLLGVISSIGGFWLSDLTSRVNSISHELGERSQRVSVLEANVEGLNKRLDRIELKIDYLIQEKGKRP
jgi:hypothetical protein